DSIDISERASARETAGRVAGGAICAQLLSKIGVQVMGCTLAIGGEWAQPFDLVEAPDQVITYRAMRDTNPYYAVAPSVAWKQILSAAEDVGDTLGGIFGVIAAGIPAGLGSHVQWTEKLDAILARALMSIQAVKSVEFGSATAAAEMQGSDYHGDIVPGSRGVPAPTTQNHGGIAGGMTDGSPLMVRCAVKPVPTLSAPMKSVNLATGEKAIRPTERHDTCAVPAAGVIGENVVAFELLRAVLERYGASSYDELKKRMEE
ncbi:MAG: chorismate synthase, partial [Planctomycetota bacterium]